MDIVGEKCIIELVFKMNNSYIWDGYIRTRKNKSDHNEFCSQCIHDGSICEYFLSVVDGEKCMKSFRGYPPFDG